MLPQVWVKVVEMEPVVAMGGLLARGANGISAQGALWPPSVGVRRTPGQGEVGSLFDEENTGWKDCQILPIDGAVNDKPLNVISATKFKKYVFRDQRAVTDSVWLQEVSGGSGASVSD